MSATGCWSTARWRADPVFDPCRRWHRGSSLFTVLERYQKSALQGAFLIPLFNGSAAQHLVAVIEHRRLSGGDGPLRLVEGQAHPALRQRLRQRRGLHLTVPGLGGAAEGRGRSLTGDPVDPVRRQLPAEQLLLR